MAADATTGLGQVNGSFHRHRPSQRSRRRLPKPSDPLISSGSKTSRSFSTKAKGKAKGAARWFRVRGRKIISDTYFGEVSIPGVTNLYFAVKNAIDAFHLIKTGKNGSCKEYIIDGALKFVASIVTFTLAIAQLMVLLAPIVHYIDELYQSVGSYLHNFIHVGGVVISAIELVCKSAQLVRQCMFDRNFEYKDIFHTQFEMKGGNACDVEKQFKEWKTLVLSSEKAIVSFMGQKSFDKCKASLETLDQKVYRDKMGDIRSLQRKLKRRWLNRNFTIMHNKHFDMSGKTDQATIKTYKKQEVGEEVVANQKLITIYRRIQCPKLAGKLNEFLVPKDGIVDGNFVTRANAKDAEKIFRNIQVKSHQIKIIHTIAIAALFLVTLSFVLMTGGVGTAVVAPVLFWLGWTTALGAGLYETVTIPCLQEKPEDKSYNFRYIIPLKKRREWYPLDPASQKIPNLPQRVNRMGIADATHNPMLRRLAAQAGA